MAAADLAHPTRRHIMEEFRKSITKINEEHFSKMMTIISENQKQLNKLFEQCIAVVNDGAGDAHSHEDPHLSALEQSDADPDGDADVLSGLNLVEDENGLNADSDKTDVVVLEEDIESAEPKNRHIHKIAPELFDENPKKNSDILLAVKKVGSSHEWGNDCTVDDSVHDTYKLDLEGNDLVYNSIIVSTFGAFPRVKLKFNVLFEQCFKQCKTQLVAPVLRKGVDEFRNNATMSLVEVLRQGFTLNYIIDEEACSACMNSNGLCGSLNSDSKRFQCLCRDGAYPVSCPKHGAKMKVGVKVGIALASLTVGIAFTALACCLHYRRKKFEYGSSLISRDISSYPASVDSEKGGTCMGVPIFSYAELEKATNNFDSNREVGDGGFGTVYKGKLQYGHVVAVKRLYEHNFKRVEQFMNEIEILAHLRHKNLVPLYGCTSQHCRQLLLVYEYVPNGTIADHLYGNLAKPGKFAWKTRMNIATETASALSYLHASDVIYRDVKTTNILLDNSFSVKVADFVLSPQGTPGYLDPEYHECYQLTDKSDVYSFEVVLIELISLLPAVDITRHRHEINLSNMAINKIQNDAFKLTNNVDFLKLHGMSEPRSFLVHCWHHRSSRGFYRGFNFLSYPDFHLEDKVLSEGVGNDTAYAIKIMGLIV